MSSSLRDELREALEQDWKLIARVQKTYAAKAIEGDDGAARMLARLVEVRLRIAWRLERDELREEKKRRECSVQPFEGFKNPYFAALCDPPVHADPRAESGIDTRSAERGEKRDSEPRAGHAADPRSDRPPADAPAKNPAAGLPAAAADPRRAVPSSKPPDPQRGAGPSRPDARSPGATNPASCQPPSNPAQSRAPTTDGHAPRPPTP